MKPLLRIADAWRTSHARDRALLAGLVLLGVFILVSAAIAAHERNDMDIFLAAARDMLAGENMYLMKYNSWYSYFYSPLFALLISPLLALPMPLAKFAWALLGFTALARSFVLLGRTLCAGLSRTECLAVLFCTLLFLLQSVRDNVNAMQVTLILVWLCIEGLALINRAHWVLGGALIALGIDMKMIPVVLLPYLIWRGQWKPTVAICAWVAAFYLLPALFIGWDRLADLNGTRYALLDPSDARHVIDEEEPSFIALGSLLSAYLSDLGGNDHTLALPRNLATLNVEQLGWLLLAGRLILVALTLRFLKWPPFTKSSSELGELRPIAYILLVCVLIFPHQRYYSFYLAAPAVMFIARAVALRCRNNPSPRLLLAGCAMVYLITNAELLLGEFAAVYMHYKLLSFMVLALIILLWWARPQDSMANGTT